MHNISLSVSEYGTLLHLQCLPFLQGYRITYMGEKDFVAEIIRPYGYAPVSKSFTDCYTCQSKERSNVIGALYKKGRLLLSMYIRM